MTDLTIRGKNPLTGFALRMNVHNVDGFDEETQDLFKRLAHAVEYPRQATLDEWRADE